jgi:hypothetical protein
MDRVDPATFCDSLYCVSKSGEILREQLESIYEISVEIAARDLQRPTTEPSSTAWD